MQDGRAGVCVRIDISPTQCEMVERERLRSGKKRLLHASNMNHLRTIRSGLITFPGRTMRVGQYCSRQPYLTYPRQGVSIFVSTDNSSPPENPFANRMDIDSEPQTRHVLYWEHDADVDVLLEYRRFRYHLLLRETDTVSTENRTLAMLHDALDREDNEALDRITM